MSGIRDLLIRGSEKVIGDYRLLLASAKDEEERELYRSRIERELRLLDELHGGLPPGGGRGPSSAQMASRISSIVTGAFSPSGARSDGQDAIAEASEAHEARMARFSARVRPE